jgi:transposase-like protein
MAILREKGKIPRSEWTEIFSRYRKGETIAKIARDYGCTAPAIRYIVKRSGGLASGPGRATRRSVSSETTEERASTRQTPAPPMLLEGREDRSEQLPPLRPADHRLLGAALHQRIANDVAAFLVALDHAMAEGSVEAITELQETSDRLMRSTARTRIELDRVLSRYGARAEDATASTVAGRFLLRDG